MDYVLDSFAWLEYFGGNGKFRDFVEVEKTFTASTSLTEIVRALIRKGKSGTDIQKHIEYIRKKSTVIPIGIEEAVSAGFLAEHERLLFSDALIYALASENRKLVTGDAHFRGKRNVEFVG